MKQTAHQWDNSTFECDKLQNYWNEGFETLFKMWNILLWNETLHHNFLNIISRILF